MKKENELRDLAVKLNYNGSNVFIAPDKNVTMKMVVEDMVDLLTAINVDSNRIEPIFTTKEL